LVIQVNVLLAGMRDIRGAAWITIADASISPNTEIKPMSMFELTPWNWRHGVPPEKASEAHPIQSLQREVDRLFEGFFRGGLAPFAGLPGGNGTLVPHIDVSESDTGIQVSVELPGVDEQDLDVTLTDGVLVIKGEKKEQKEEKDKRYHRVERSYGSFRRSLALPPEVDESKVTATFVKGVLTVDIPKKAEAKTAARKIQIKAA
jgi:HSP20 family protein